jgi:hypothetical protein
MRWLAAFQLFVAAPAVAAPQPVASVTVVRSGDKWTADYSLHERAPLWLFAKSILPRESRTSWRVGSVRVLTPGVRLQRVGNYDALIPRRGTMPRKVRLSFTPYVKDVEAGYDPALAFSDGSVALYADQFRIQPMPSLAAARRADRDDSTLPSADRPTRMTLIDRAGPVLFKGQRTARAEITNGEAYVLFGKAQPVIGPAMTTIIDPAMPRWVADALNSDMPRILQHYRDTLGPSPVGQPTLLASWGGPTKGVTSLGGSVLTGMVVMTLEGEGIMEPNDKARHHARWFVAHEAAHFWLGQAVTYATPAESWITEGGAELLAFRATAATDSSFDVRKRLREARAECMPFLPNGGIAGAYRRQGDFRAYYACGAIIALAAERASNGDFAGFVRTLIARFGGDGIVTRVEWLALLDERAPGLSLAVSDMLDKPHPDGKAALDEFVKRAAIGDQF